MSDNVETGSVYNLYGGYFYPQDGPFKVVSIQGTILFLQYKDEAFLRCVEKSYFEEMFKLREE